MRKIKDFIIYRNDMFFSAFPSLIRRPDGELLCVFRRAPSQNFLYGKAKDEHCDPNSQIVLVRSTDDGETWSEPQLVYANPLGGAQECCMSQLSDGSILMSSFSWALPPPEAAEKMDRTPVYLGFAFLGGHMHRSEDGGKTWLGPFIPMHIPSDDTVDALGRPSAAHNRNEIIEMEDGTLLWAAAANEGKQKPFRSSEHLLSSKDRGETWEYVCLIARDDKVGFNEASLVKTVGGDLVVFMRTVDNDAHMAWTRSTDGGKRFGPWQDVGFYGYPPQSEVLRDGRVLLMYGSRREPFGVKAKILNPECTDIAEAEEFVIRGDGGMGDLGYPWPVQLADGRVIVAYYMNLGGGTRHIAGSILEVE